MKYQVFILREAEDDLFDIYRYIATNDSGTAAENILKKLEDACFSLSEFPNRGHLPPELERVAIFDYLEIHSDPYRIIYQFIESSVFIHAILDGRRDLQDLLLQRLLKSN